MGGRVFKKDLSLTGFSTGCKTISPTASDMETAAAIPISQARKSHQGLA